MSMEEAGQKNSAEAPEEAVKREVADAPSVKAAEGASAPAGAKSEQANASNEMVVSVKMLYQTALVAAVACSVLSVFMYDRFFATKIAVFDYPDFMVRLRNGVISGAIPPEQMKTYLEMAEAKIKGQPKNYVVLSGDVLLGDGKGAKKIVDGIEIPKGPSMSQQGGSIQIPGMPPQQQIPGQALPQGASVPQVPVQVGQ